jgi:hypothetical protein
MFNSIKSLRGIGVPIEDEVGVKGESLAGMVGGRRD